jgi:hypothetical protein
MSQLSSGVAARFHDTDPAVDKCFEEFFTIAKRDYPWMMEVKKDEFLQSVRKMAYQSCLM